MKEVITGVSLLVLVFLALVFQEVAPMTFLPAGARLQLAPLIFCFAAFYLSFPLMLVFALAAGVLFDLMQLQFVGASPEIPLGVTIFFFLAVGGICQGLRPLFQKGHWWLLSLMAGLATAALPALQFLLLSIRRLEYAGFSWSEEAAWRILLPAMVAAVLAPLAQMAVHLISIGIADPAKPRLQP